ncbi:MAG: thioesterase family protein [Rikenella sp.]|nr:thioesterase family protein [Rikenella sp.]
MRPISIDTAHTSTLVVTEAHTARVLGSGDLSVFGTPAMAALMERAAMEAVAPFLEPGESSVGTALNITHDRASGIGNTIQATARIIRVEGRRIDFRIEATDLSNATTIGSGTHTRFVVDVEKFMRKIEK